MKLFVYGTLQMGQCNHQWLQHMPFLGDSTISGYRLYVPDHGCFPYIFPEEYEYVDGELYEICDPQLLKLLDRREVGYDRTHIANGVYAYVGKPEYRKQCTPYFKSRWSKR